jgi:hypothetical protein
VLAVTSMTQLPATTRAPPLRILILPIGDPLSALTFRAQGPDVVIVAGRPSRSHPGSPTLAMLMLMPPVPEFTLPGAAGVVPVPLTLVQYKLETASCHETEPTAGGRHRSGCGGADRGGQHPTCPRITPPRRPKPMNAPTEREKPR